MNNSLRSTLAIALACCFTLSTPAFARQAAQPIQGAVQEQALTTDVDVADIEAMPPAVADAPADAMAPVDAAAPTEAMEPATDSTPAKNPAPADPGLLPVYKDFGELPGLTALMDDFMVLLLADPRMRPFFENADQAAIKKHLVEQFCVILGGPCTYTGRNMKASHAGLEINRNNFNALVEDLQVAMNKHGIPFRSQNKLLAKLAPMHHEIETQ